MSGISRIKGFINDIRIFNDELKNRDELVSVYGRRFVLFDFLFSMILYGCRKGDYLFCQLYKYKGKERKKYATEAYVWKKVYRRMNPNKSQNDLIENKKEFNERFNPFLRRLWVDVDAVSREMFIEFCVSHDRFVVKPIIGAGGIGIEFVESKGIDVSKLYDRLRGKGVIIEECVKQCAILEQINPFSVNTIRVHTINSNGSVKIISATLRMSKDKSFVDNMYQGGIAASIDVETGVVFTEGVTLKGERYIFHPISKQQIVGVKIPNWKAVKEMVCQAAGIVPEVGWIGWDVTVNAGNEPVLIEGGAYASVDFTQMPDATGKRELFEKAIRDER